MNQVFRLIMPDGVFPFYVVFLELPANEVDVNIHPTKKEVKLKDEQAICSLLRTLTEKTLMENGLIKQVRQDSQRHYSPVQHSLQSTHRLSEVETPYQTMDQNTERTYRDDYAYPQAAQQTQTSFIPDDLPVNSNQESLQNRLGHAEFIGTFINKYLIFQSGCSLLFMDQHAAAERITYEKLIGQMKNSKVEVQQLLAPVSIKLTPQEVLNWEQCQEEFQKMGFEVTAFDEETLAVHTHPQLINDIEKAIRNILSGGKIDKSDFDTMARRACRSSIMAGDHLPAEKIAFLKEQLLQCFDPLTCPHGRPTVIEISESFLDKNFNRI